MSLGSQLIIIIKFSYKGKFDETTITLLAVSRWFQRQQQQQLIKQNHNSNYL